jgi:fructokinase
VKQFDVVAIGELLIDFTPMGISVEGKPMYEQNPGGAPANVVALLAKWGRKTSFTGKVGSDFFGSFLKETLAGHGIDCSGLTSTNQANTTLTFVQIDDHGDRAFSFYRNPGADMLLTKEDIKEKQIAASKILHFGSVSLTGGPATEATWHAVKIAKEHGKLISFDPNLREHLWSSLAMAREQILTGLSFSDIVKMSEEELEFVTGNQQIEEAAKELTSKYPIQLLFITLGAKGCFYCYKEYSGYISGYAVDAFDTTAAGDAFFGAILHQLLERKLDLEELNSKSLEDIVQFANAVGALTTTKKGAITSLPDYEQVQLFLKNHDGVKK